MALKYFLRAAFVGASTLAATAFAPPSIAIQRPHHPMSTKLHSKRIIDAEFLDKDDSSASNDSSSPTSSTETMSLIEYSQQGDTDWKSMPIAFCDTHSNTYIDCTLAFYVKDAETGEEYALGVPCETPVVVALELDDLPSASTGSGEDIEEEILANLGTVLPINPDSYPSDNSNTGEYTISEEAKEEIFQIAAKSLMEEYGQNIRLKKTPRVLTVVGDLDSQIGDWKSVLINAGGAGSKMKRPTMEEAVEIINQDEKSGEDFFEYVMKRDLGEDYMSLLEEDEDMDEDILKALEGLGENEGGVEESDVDDFLEFMKGMTKDGVDAKNFDEVLQRLKPSVALRLLSFIGPDGDNVYTILRPLRPLLLVGKEDPDDFTRRILLSEEEKREVLPKLETVCRQELEEAGFFLSGGSEEK